jgi:hypothetical protein
MINKYLMKRCMGIALLFIISFPSWAEKGILIRPHLGMGYTDVSGEGASGMARLIGSRFLLSAGGNKSYGLEVSYIEAYAGKDDKPDTDYLAVGIVLEKKPFESFNMGIGTIGYLGMGDNSDNPFGIVTNLGWEPEYKGNITPYISFRSEWIFDENIFKINTLTAGMRFRF